MSNPISAVCHMLCRLCQLKMQNNVMFSTGCSPPFSAVKIRNLFSAMPDYCILPFDKDVSMSHCFFSSLKIGSYPVIVYQRYHVNNQCVCCTFCPHPPPTLTLCCGGGIGFVSSSVTLLFPTGNKYFAV